MEANGDYFKERTNEVITSLAVQVMQHTTTPSSEVYSIPMMLELIYNIRMLMKHSVHCPCTCELFHIFPFVHIMLQEYTFVYAKLVETYSKLRDTIGSGYVSVCVSLS